MVSFGVGVPLYAYWESGAGVDVGGVALGYGGQGTIGGVFACGEAFFGIWVAEHAERPSSAARAVAGYGYDASQVAAVGQVIV